MEEQEAIQELTQDLLKNLGFDAQVEVTPQQEMYYVHIKTEDDPSLIIGKHARMLGSLQRILSAMLYKKFEHKVDILLDVNDYRESQKERLVGIADNIARRVIDEERESSLSSFSAYERRIIHEHIGENYHSLESYSEGEGKFRKLVIAPKKSL
jgi:spoIIIJ-associated protein